MEKKDFINTRLQKLQAVSAEKVTVDSGLVSKRELTSEEGDTTCLVYTPQVKDIDFLDWLKKNSSMLNDHLQKSGAILFRGFNLQTIDSFNTFLNACDFRALPYKSRSSPRHEIKHNIYTSTDHASDQMINMHTENSYAHQWPLKICFFCEQPSETGGQTPIADTRAVLRKLKESTRNKFLKKEVKYVRNLNNGVGLGLSWMTVFQTNDKPEVEKYCEYNGIDFRWKEDGGLRISYRRPAIYSHPYTDEEVWFNHAFFFNIHSLDKDLFADVADFNMFNEFPFSSFYGDGSVIEPEVIEEIQSVYEKINIKFDWQRGDVLLLDNMMMAHGRAPFSGQRKILVAMSDLLSADQLNRPTAQASKKIS